jgi:hypothetical protein
MEKKEKVKDFNQHFTTILNKLSTKGDTLETMFIEHYTLEIHPSIGMFVKQVSKVTLA